MQLLFLGVNTFLGTAGAYLVFKRFRHAGHLTAGLALVISAGVAMANENWWPMLAGAAFALAAHRFIGDPFDA